MCQASAATVDPGILAANPPQIELLLGHRRTLLGERAGSITGIIVFARRFAEVVPEEGDRGWNTGDRRQETGDRVKKSLHRWLVLFTLTDDPRLLTSDFRLLSAHSRLLNLRLSDFCLLTSVFCLLSSVFPVPCSLFPIPYSLFPTPYSLLPVPCPVPYLHAVILDNATGASRSTGAFFPKA